MLARLSHRRCALILSRDGAGVELNIGAGKPLAFWAAPCNSPYRSMNDAATLLHSNWRVVSKPALIFAVRSGAFDSAS
jgi:hypothetical protein